jgi:hypothetical protein
VRTEPEDHNTVFYRFVVAGRTYDTSGPSHLPNPPARYLAPGQRITVVYDRLDPTNSCACTPDKAWDSSPAANVLFPGGFFALVLTGPVTYFEARRGRWLTHRWGPLPIPIKVSYDDGAGPTSTRFGYPTGIPGILVVTPGALLLYPGLAVTGPLAPSRDQHPRTTHTDHTVLVLDTGDGTVIGLTDTHAPHHGDTTYVYPPTGWHPDDVRDLLATAGFTPT